jgi:hypothetical protein
MNIMDIRSPSGKTILHTSEWEGGQGFGKILLGVEAETRIRSHGIFGKFIYLSIIFKR